MPSLCHLWVIVNNGLTWSLHISSVVAKAYKTLGVLNRQSRSSIIGPSHRKPLYVFDLGSLPTKLRQRNLGPSILYKGHEIVRECAEASHKIYLELQQRPKHLSKL